MSVIAVQVCVFCGNDQMITAVNGLDAVNKTITIIISEFLSGKIRSYKETSAASASQEVKVASQTAIFSGFFSHFHSDVLKS